MSDLRPLQPLTLLPGAGPACEGDDCLPAAETPPATTASA
jgi:hypothetical protein